MAYEMRDNSGSLFKNDKREKETHPHAKGTALIDGVEYWVSAWTKTGQKGMYQSLSFQRKEQQEPVRKADPRVVRKMMDTYDAHNPPRRDPDDERTSYGGSAAALDDEIPFSAEFR